MKKILYLSIVLLAFSSCVIQFVSGTCYKYLSENERKVIHKYNKDSLLINRNIYEMTGPQLLSELKKQDSSLVYFFKNGCTSKYCLPISTVIEYADRNKLKLYLVMRSYFNLDETFSQPFESPLFSINVNYYGGDNESDKYIQSFSEDIGYTKLLNKRDMKWMGNFLFFKRGKLVRIQKYIFEN